MTAAANGHLEVVRLLLDRGASVDAADEVRLLRTHVRINTRICMFYERT